MRVEPPTGNRLPTVPRYRVLFVIGRPCGGKSEVVRMIRQQLVAAGYKGEMIELDDFPHLWHIFRQDQAHRRHRPTEDGGLEVTDDSVWDDLSEKLSADVLRLCRPDLLLIVQMARSSYLRALSYFDSEIKKHALIIYVQASWDVCWTRNVSRGHHKPSRYIARPQMEKEFRSDDIQDLAVADDLQVAVISNETDSLEDLRAEVRDLMPTILPLGVNPHTCSSDR